MNVEELPLLGEPVPVEFANSLYLDDGEATDFLATPEATRLWFRSAFGRSGPMLPPLLGDQGNLELRGLRDAVRSALEARLESERAPAPVIELLNRHAAAACAAAKLSWTFQPSVEIRYVGSPLDVLRAQIATSAIELLTGSDAGRVRRCEGPGCSLFFVQQHRRRRFCHESCSHRSRQMRYYRRHKSNGARAAAPRLDAHPEQDDG